jgi:hypothetical protein
VVMVVGLCFGSRKEDPASLVGSDHGDDDSVTCNSRDLVVGWMHTLLRALAFPHPDLTSDLLDGDGDGSVVDFRRRQPYSGEPTVTLSDDSGNPDPHCSNPVVWSIYPAAGSNRPSILVSFSCYTSMP